MSNGIIAVTPMETMYTLTDLQEGTEYSINVTAILSGRAIEKGLTAFTVVAG